MTQVALTNAVADSDVPSSVQIGLPLLPEAGADAHFEVIKGWLDDCDKHHSSFKCTSSTAGWFPTSSPAIRGDARSRATPPHKKFRLPTRLIDVGRDDASTVRLYETQPGDRREDFDYVALSHPWGDHGKKPPGFRAFFTTRRNLAEHKKQIEVTSLVPTFRDAVHTTRAVGRRYLWIDSICIIQGDDGDFNSESKRMEDVYNSAYCVIAASSAEGQWDGFLKSRPPRDYATFRRGAGSPFYVCQFIDNFNRDVLDGDLNNRGWVLQERALARRTIYFTEQQTYFECGDGVRCETLTKMRK